MSNSAFQQNYTQLPTFFYTRQEPEPMVDGQLVHINKALCDELGIKVDEDTLLNMTTGQSFPSGITPLAQKYTGHQFGYYNPDLGDGRGVLLGQVEDNKQNFWDLHLKGSGRTPYSRRGDGRAVLRSAVREYLIGEALHALGVPTTRCLSLCTSPELVRREQYESRATYIRIAKTHIRFGHFEWLAEIGKIEEQKQLADHVIETVYPELAEIKESSQRYAELLKTITENTAKLIAAWQAVGFCHGVMNTDNMSVAGETFDFGPYAFLDDCKIHYICNHSDTEGRYAYSQQPNIGLWNCQVLAQSFSSIVDPEAVDTAINTYVETFNQQYLLKMGYKFGLDNPVDNDKNFIADTLILLDESNLDFHQFFHSLKHFDTEQHELFETFILNSKAWSNWQQTYRQKTQTIKSKTRLQTLSQNTPQLILRNYIAQDIIQQVENGQFQVLADWMAWLKNPHNPDNIFQQASHQHYLKPPSDCQKGLALSCSS